jgi:hypothetical protein
MKSATFSFSMLNLDRYHNNAMQYNSKQQKQVMCVVLKGVHVIINIQNITIHRIILLIALWLIQKRQSMPLF